MIRLGQTVHDLLCLGSNHTLIDVTPTSIAQRDSIQQRAKCAISSPIDLLQGSILPLYSKGRRKSGGYPLQNLTRGMAYEIIHPML